MTLAQLKKSSTTNFDKLNEKINAMMNPTRQDSDDRFWQPTVDKAGNGYAVIRFLPPPEVDEIPFARVWDHGFRGPGGWYIENSLTTIDKPDPVTEYNNHLWNSGNEDDRIFVTGKGKDQPGSKRRLHFYSNILVVEDPGNKENVGKVFLYKYGKKIFDKLNNAMNPKFPDQPKINPFDMWNGANLRLRIQRVEGQRNYDESVLDTPSPVAKTDAAIEAIWKQTYSLKEFTDPANFKSYAELKAKLDRVLASSYKVGKTVEDQDKSEPPVFPVKKATKVEETAPWVTGEEDDDDASTDSELSRLKALVE